MKRSDYLWLIVLTAVLAVLQLWLRPILPVDETRYLSVAWEMWSRGDFLVPHLNGEPYSHKPPLLFWLIHTSWSVFGVSAWPARLLMPMLSLACLWMTVRLAHRLWPQSEVQIAALAPWLLFGSLFWMNFFTLIQFDLLLTLAALLVWYALLEFDLRPLHAWLLLGIGVGLGVLAKGPVILLLITPAILLAPWWARDTRPHSWIHWYLRVLSAFGAGVVLALAWAIPAGQAGGTHYQQAIFWGQSAGRVVDSFAHQSPWWSYLWWLPLMWVPWILWPRVWKSIRAGVPVNNGIRFCLAVVIPAIVLFSLVSGKQGKYLLPLFPLIALLMAKMLSSSSASENVIQSARRITLSMVVLTSLVYLLVVPRYQANYDLQAVSDRLQQIQFKGHPIAWLGKYHGQFHFLGRLEKPIQPLGDTADVRGWLDAHPKGYLLVNYRDLPELPDTLDIYPYRSGNIVLWGANSLLNSPRQLDGLPGKS